MNEVLKVKQAESERKAGLDRKIIINFYKTTVRSSANSGNIE